MFMFRGFSVISKLGSPKSAKTPFRVQINILNVPRCSLQPSKYGVCILQSLRGQVCGEWGAERLGLVEIFVMV